MLLAVDTLVNMFKNGIRDFRDFTVVGKVEKTESAESEFVHCGIGESLLFHNAGDETRFDKDFGKCGG